MPPLHRLHLGTVAAILTFVLVSLVDGQGPAGCIAYTDPTTGNPWICTCPRGGSLNLNGCYDSCMVTFDACICGGGSGCGDAYNSCGDACLNECIAYIQSCPGTSTSTTSLTTSATTTSASPSPTAGTCRAHAKRVLLRSTCTYRGLGRCKGKCGKLAQSMRPGPGNGCGREIDDLLRAGQHIVAPDFTPACNAHDVCFDKCDNTGAGFDLCNMAFKHNLDKACASRRQAVYDNCQKNICRGLTKAERAKCLSLPSSVKECEDEWQGALEKCQMDVKAALKIVQGGDSCQAYRDAQTSHCKCNVK